MDFRLIEFGVRGAAIATTSYLKLLLQLFLWYFQFLDGRILLKGINLVKNSYQSNLKEVLRLGVPKQLLNPVYLLISTILLRTIAN